MFHPRPEPLCRFYMLSTTLLKNTAYLKDSACNATGLFYSSSLPANKFITICNKNPL